MKLNKKEFLEKLTTCRTDYDSEKFKQDKQDLDTLLQQEREKIRYNYYKEIDKDLPQLIADERDKVTIEQMKVNLAYTKRKVEEERERCAKIAESFTILTSEDKRKYIMNVAKAIRK